MIRGVWGKKKSGRRKEKMNIRYLIEIRPLT